MRSKILRFIFPVCFILLPYSIGAATPIYYSVGTKTSALYVGNASASAGLLTLATPACDSIGMGDELRVGSSRYYITRRNSATVFSIQNSKANGGSPGRTNITFASTAVEIRRAFNTLNSACLGAMDANHLGTSNLVSGGYVLHLACYGDGVDPTGVSVNGYTTGPENYLRIFTPVHSHEAGFRQRHGGKWSDAAYRIKANNCFTIADEYVHIEGIQMDVGTGDDNGFRGVYTSGTAGNGLHVTQCIVRLDTTLIQNYGDYCEGISLGVDVQGSFYISNNIVYNFKKAGKSNNKGIVVTKHFTGKTYLHNNTVAHCYNGIVDGYGGIDAVNNIVQNCANDGFVGSFGGNSDYNLSDMAADAPGAHSRNSLKASFVDAGAFDYHLAAHDTAARDRGTSLALHAQLRVSGDIEGQIRVNPCDIGADEYIAADASAPAVTAITSPAGGEAWGTGEAHAISFSATDNTGIAGFLFEVSSDSGVSWKAAGDTLIAPSPSFSGSFLWTVNPDIASTRCMIRVTAFDAFGNFGAINSAAFTVVDSTNPVVAIHTPNGGEDWPLSSIWEIKWTAYDNIGLAACSLYISRDNGALWAVLGVASGSDTAYSWIAQGDTSGRCLIRAVAIDAGGLKGYDTSNAPFRISPPDLASPVVSGITVPGAPNVGCGTTLDLTWSSSDDHGVVLCSLFYSIDNGGTYTLIKDSAANFQSYAWKVPTTLANQCRILVRAYDVLKKKGEGVSSSFAIRDLTAPTDTLVSPNGGENWAAGSTRLITWKTADNIGVTACSLFYSTNKTTWNKIGGTDGSARSFSWVLPGTPMPLCWVMVVCYDAASNAGTDTSAAPFSVIVKPYLTSPDSVNVAAGGALNYNLTFGGPSASIALSCLSGCIANGGWVNQVGNLLTGIAPNVTREDTVKILLSAAGYPADTVKIRIKISLSSDLRNTAEIQAPVFGFAAQISPKAITFMVGVEKSGPFSLEVFDLMGRKIWSHVESNAVSGFYPIAWKVASGRFGSGVCLVRLKQQNRTMCRKISVF